MHIFFLRFFPPQVLFFLLTPLRCSPRLTEVPKNMGRKARDSSESESESDRRAKDVGRGRGDHGVHRHRPVGMGPLGDLLGDLLGMLVLGIFFGKNQQTISTPEKMVGN